MTRLRFLAGAALAAMLATLSGQADSKRTPEQLKVSYAAHKSDFDYLLGDWEFTSESREYGKFGGRWSAVRLETGQILDEYRVVGDKGETFHVTSTIRSYNAAADHWELIGMDGGGGGKTSAPPSVSVRRCISNRNSASRAASRRFCGSVITTFSRITFPGARRVPQMAAGRG